MLHKSCSTHTSCGPSRAHRSSLYHRRESPQTPLPCDVAPTSMWFSTVSFVPFTSMEPLGCMMPRVCVRVISMQILGCMMLCVFVPTSEVERNTCSLVSSDVWPVATTCRRTSDAKHVDCRIRSETRGSGRLLGDERRPREDATGRQDSGEVVQGICEDARVRGRKLGEDVARAHGSRRNDEGRCGKVLGDADRRVMREHASCEQGTRHASGGGSHELGDQERSSQEEETQCSELANPGNDGEDAGLACEVQRIEEKGQESAPRSALPWKKISQKTAWPMKTCTQRLQKYHVAGSCEFKEECTKKTEQGAQEEGPEE